MSSPHQLHIPLSALLTTAKEGFSVSSLALPTRPDCYCIGGDDPHYNAAQYKRVLCSIAALEHAQKKHLELLRSALPIVASVASDESAEGWHAIDICIAIDKALEEVNESC